MPRRSRSRAVLATAAAVGALALLASPALAAVAPTPNSVSIGGSPAALTVDGNAFKIKGIAYSPVPNGESVHFQPHGDYFTPDYAYLWARDLPALKAMGVNVLRIYSWNNKVDHSPFLDACTQFGVKVMLTHYVGSTTDTPINTAAERQQAVDDFAAHVALLGDHPAILAWSFGNELNGAWNGFKGAFDTAFNCKWNTPGGTNCENQVAAPGSDCFKAQDCMYGAFFGWLNDAMGAAKKHTTRPMTSTFADVDYLVSGNPTTDKIKRFDALMPNMDAYAIQLYRGYTFGNFFQQYAQATNKPLIVGEYGVDSYNDPCGWGENFNSMRPCYNYPGQPGMGGGSDATPNFVGCTSSDSCKKPGVEAQVEWDKKLAQEILAADSNLGGILMEWHDENWKNTNTEDKCTTACPSGQEEECARPGSALHDSFAMGGSAGCTYKAHVSCPSYDTNKQQLCGYYLNSAPDQYVNEAWFGVNSVEDCGWSDVNTGHRMSALTPRPIVSAMAGLFGSSNTAAATTGKTCAQLKPCYDCVRAESVDAAHSAPGVLSGKCDAVCGITFKGATYTDGATNGGTTNPDGTTNPPPAGQPNNGGGGGSGSTTTDGGSVRSSAAKLAAPVLMAAGLALLATFGF